MLNRIRRASSFMLETNNISSKNGNNSLSSIDHISKSSSGTDSGDDIYIETILYIVHVDDIEDENNNNNSNNDDSTTQFSKRTTASFNERHLVSRRNSEAARYSFTNPLRKLNKKSTLFSTSTAKNLNRVSSHRFFNRLIQQPDLSIVKYDDKEQSTLNESCEQAEIYAEGTGLQHGDVDETCKFDIHAPGAMLNQLIIAIDGPSKADIIIEVIGYGIYRVHYKCQVVGRYTISITYNGKNIRNSPYNIRLSKQDPISLPSPLQVIPSVDIFPVNCTFEVDSTSLVIVRPAVSCAIFQAQIRTPNEHNLPITVQKSSKSECYEIQFLPNEVGIHWLHLTINGIEIENNPILLTVTTSETEHQEEQNRYSLASGQGLFHAYT
ncbi:unnamed protein product, partial [Didymodactylos carnosus]